MLLAPGLRDQYYFKEVNTKIDLEKICKKGASGLILAAGCTSGKSTAYREIDNLIDLDSILARFSVKGGDCDEFFASTYCGMGLIMVVNSTYHLKTFIRHGWDFGVVSVNRDHLFGCGRTIGSVEMNNYLSYCMFGSMVKLGKDEYLSDMLRQLQMLEVPFHNFSEKIHEWRRTNVPN